MCYNTSKKGGTIMNTKDTSQHSPKLQWIIPLILSISLVLLGSFLFLYNYENAFDAGSNGWFLSPGVVVFLYFLCMAAVAAGISVLLRYLLKGGINLRLLLVISICLPLLCYTFNNFALKKGGMLHFLVEEGGALHFVTIHDFNFDGVNDAYDYTGDDVREISGGPIYSTDIHDPIEYYEYVVVGKGGKLGYAGCEANYAADKISIRMNRSRVTYEGITITLHLKEGVPAEKVTLTQGGSPIEKTVIDEHTVSFTFDAATCAAWQEAAMNESFRIYVFYEVND